MLIFNQRELKERRRQLRASATASEIFLWSHLRRGELGTKFRRQFGIGAYVLDFYAPIPKLAIEVDGNSHDDKQEYDELRQNEIESYGIEFLRFTDLEVLNNIGSVLERIKARIQSSLS